MSLTFDDARASQLDVAAPILERHGVRATFYVLPEHVRRRRADWHALVAGGHEIGNHTSTHPCSGNFPFSSGNALEDISEVRMEADIDRASWQIQTLLGTRPSTFAYPCGQSFLGRGDSRRSYVPLVARRFLAGRGYGGETANDPTRCDLAHLDAFAIDGLDADALLGLVDDERADGRWVILAGHDVGDDGEQTVLVSAFERICRRLTESDVWVAPVREVARRLRPAR